MGLCTETGTPCVYIFFCLFEGSREEETEGQEEEEEEAAVYLSFVFCFLVFFVF